MELATSSVRMSEGHTVSFSICEGLAVSVSVSVSDISFYVLTTFFTELDWGVSKQLLQVRGITCHSATTSFSC